MNSSLPHRLGNDEGTTNDRADDRTVASRGRHRLRRSVTTLVAVLVLLTAIFYLGGGWYFSGQIHQDGLAVKHGLGDLTLRVDGSRRDRVCPGAPAAPDVAGRAAISCGSVALRETGEDQRALDEPIVYGLDWRTGYGQVYGAPTAGPGGDVTRRLLVLDGAPPRRGDAARLDRSSFPANPSVALDRPVRNVQYRSPAGRFPAWFTPGKGATWAILVHGYRSSRTEVLRAMTVTTAIGLPTLAITHRNDQGAPPDPSRLYRFGETEWRDLEGAVRYAVDHGARRVDLVANSMGGAVTAAFLQRSPLARRVSAVVLDSPMLDFGQTVSYGASQRSLPVLGSVPESLVWTAERLASLRYGVDWQAIDYLRDTSWVRVPTLVLHGTADLRVPYSSSRRLARAEPGLVQLRTFRGAEHVGAWNQDPRRYTRLVSAFLR